MLVGRGRARRQRGAGEPRHRAPSRRAPRRAPRAASVVHSLDPLGRRAHPGVGSAHPGTPDDAAPRTRAAPVDDGALHVGQGERHGALGASQPLLARARLDRHGREHRRAGHRGSSTPSVVPMPHRVLMATERQTRNPAGSRGLGSPRCCARSCCSRRSRRRSLRAPREPAGRPAERLDVAARRVVDRAERVGDGRADRHRPAHAPPAAARGAAQARAGLSRTRRRRASARRSSAGTTADLERASPRRGRASTARRRSRPRERLLGFVAALTRTTM